MKNFLLDSPMRGTSLSSSRVVALPRPGQTAARGTPKLLLGQPRARRLNRFERFVRSTAYEVIVWHLIAGLAMVLVLAVFGIAGGAR